MGSIGPHGLWGQSWWHCGFLMLPFGVWQRVSNIRMPTSELGSSVQTIDTSSLLTILVYENQDCSMLQLYGSSE